MGARTVIAAGLVALASVVVGVAGACARESTARVSHTNASTDGGEARVAPAASGPPLIHPTGLVLGAQPPAVRVSETAAGFRAGPAASRRMRNPWSVDLRLADADPLEDGARVERTKVGDRDVHYHVSVDDDSGSGGPLFTLTAWTACEFRRIVMTAGQQAEPPAKPDWSFAWSILAASRCQPRQAHHGDGP